MSFPLLTLLLLACSVGDDGPATPGSPSAAAVAEVAEVERLAGEIEAQAIELEEVVQASRGQADPAARAAAAAEVARRTAAIAEAEGQLRQRLETLDALLHRQAGDPAPPPADDAAGD